MSGRFIVSLFSFGVLLALVRAEARGPQSYGTAYQNITSERKQEGFIQLFGMCINKTQIYVLGDNKTFVESRILQMAGVGNQESYNFTPTYSSALLQNDPVSTDASKNPKISPFGILISSADPCHFVSSKQDLGTGDAYLLLAQTNNSVQFMIAAWPRVEGRPFLAMIMVIPVLDGTCVDMYKIYRGSEYLNVYSEILGQYQIARYFAGFYTWVDEQDNFHTNLTVGEDMTGMKVNASKPVQVIVGCECAWVPTPQDLFCDYIAETMIPISEMGKEHIFPPIFGRSTKAGYIGRVVASEDHTTITVGLSPPVTVTIRLGEYYQFDAPDASKSTVVTCDKPCLCAQYNKGYLDYDDVPTDPYMVGVVPVDRFTAGAPFGTDSFCEAQGVLIDFSNWITIVTYYNYKDQILYDGSPISDQFSGVGGSSWVTVMIGQEKYAVAGFAVEPGFHYCSMTPGNDGSFVVYVYGHSLDPDSSSGYGYFANFNTTGIPVSANFAQAKKVADAVGGPPDVNATCSSEQYLVGSVITGNVGQYVPFPFYLTAGINPPVPLTPECLAQYHDQLLQLLKDFSRKINYWICVSKNCSYLGGEGVCINYATLDVKYLGAGDGTYSSVQVYVEMDARFDVSSQNFAHCRAEIQNYMHDFINWPPQYTPNLLHSIVGSGCPFPIPFQKPMFDASPLTCPTYTSYNYGTGTTK